MPIQRYSDHEVLLNSKTHNSLRHPNPPNAILSDLADRREDPPIRVLFSLRTYSLTSTEKRQSGALSKHSCPGIVLDTVISSPEIRSFARSPEKKSDLNRR